MRVFVIVSAFVAAALGLSSSAIAAGADTATAHAHDLANATLKVMNQIEPLATITAPERLSRDTHERKFTQPLDKVEALWPTPTWSPEFKPMIPYAVCLDATEALRKLHDLRLMGVLPKEVEKARHDYFSDKKPRCEAAVKNGR